MLFVCLLDILPGKAREAIQLAKKAKLPKGVKVTYFLGMFGKPDGLFIFESPSEKAAAQFVLQFSPVMQMRTSLAFPMKEI